MTLQQIRYFISVVQKLSFSRAAEEHFVSQTAISQQIKLLEEELGVKLFERNHRTIEVTPIGTMYYEYAVQIITMVELAAVKVKEAVQCDLPPLRISVMEGLECEQVVGWIQDFKEKYPSVKLQFNRHAHQDSYGEVMNHSIDLALVLEVSPAPLQLERMELYRAQRYVVLNRQHPLSTQLTLQHWQLNGEQLYVPTKDATFIQTFRNTGIDAEKAISVDSLESLQLNITFYGGYAVIAKPILTQMISNRNLTFIPLEGDKVPVCLIWDRANQNQTMKLLIEYIQENFLDR